MRTDGGKKQVGNVRVIAWAMVWFCVTGLAAPGTEWVLEFTGNNSYIELGTPGALQIPSGEPFTVEGWMYFHSLSSRDMLYSKNNARSGSPYDYMLGFIDGNITAYDGGNWRYPSPSGDPIEMDRWYHVAFSYDGNDMHYYLDGELVGAYDGWDFTSDPDHSIKFGGYTGSAGDIDGMKSDIRVWDHARTEAQIAVLRSNRLSGAETGLVGYWAMNEGDGTTVYE